MANVLGLRFSTAKGKRPPPTTRTEIFHPFLDSCVYFRGMDNDLSRVLASNVRDRVQSPSGRTRVTFIKTVTCAILAAPVNFRHCRS